MPNHPAPSTSTRPTSTDRSSRSDRLVGAIVRDVYVPVMLVGFGGIVVALAAADVPKVTFGILIVGAIAMSFAAERVRPYEAAWNDARGDLGRDVAHAVVNEIAVVANLAVFPLLAATVTLVDIWPHDVPFVVQVVVAVVVLDAGVTLAHLASHHVGALWRLHAVHHSVTRFYGLNGLMKHPVHQQVELAAGVTPLVLIGLPPAVALAAAALVAVQLLVQHSNVDYRAGFLDRWLALNRVHRFHHLKWPGIGDVNFGLFTTIWDRMLGTYTDDPTKRFHSDLLGIAAQPDYPVRYLAQLAQPFARRRSHTDASAVGELSSGAFDEDREPFEVAPRPASD